MPIENEIPQTTSLSTQYHVEAFDFGHRHSEIERLIL